MKTCLICNRPADDGYVNAAAGEACADLHATAGLEREHHCPTCPPDDGEQDNAFEIICHKTGDSAEAETAEAALVAADTLARDHADATRARGALDAARRSLTILERGTYNGTLTELARRGHRQPVGVAELDAKGLALTRSVTTPTLAQSFRDTDALLDQAGLTADQRHELTTARGWILTVLEERGHLAAIGLDSNYDELPEATA